MSDYYVKPTSISGSDSNDGSTFALAKETLNAVYALCSAGDTVYVCSDSDDPFDDITLTLDGVSNVTFIGADTTDGTPYTGSNRAVLDGSGLTNIITVSNGTTARCKFYNLSLQGTSSVNGYSSTNSGGGHTFINCEFKNLQYGAYVSKSSNQTIVAGFHDCVFSVCIRGLYLRSIANNYYTGCICNTTNCIFKNNGYGIFTGIVYNSSAAYIDNHSLNIISCRFLSNTVAIRNEGHLVLNLNMNVFYLNNSHAISLDGAYILVNVRNNIFSSNGGYAISSDVASSLDSFCGFVDYNCYYNNTLGNVNSNINGGTTPGSNNITSNPLFASTTLGAEDFRLQEASPCLGVGIGYVSGQ